MEQRDLQSTNSFPLGEPWLILGERRFYSRLLIGIEQYDSPALVKQVIESARVEMLTVTFDLEGSREGLPLAKLAETIPIEEYTLIGTTSFARSAAEAITVAKMLRQSLGIEIIKLDVRTDYTTPNNGEVVEVAEELIREGFYVLPMIIPEQNAALELERIGCSAIRLLGSTIGSGLGLLNLCSIQQIIQIAGIPIIVEGGIRSAADAALAMEVGADAILVNTAVVKAGTPVMMASAIRMAVEAGRLAFLAVQMPKSPSN